MSVFKIGGIDLIPYTEKGSYSVTLQPEGGGNDFTTANGETVGSSIGDRVIIAAELVNVPDEYARVISNAVSAAEFEVTYSTPCTATEKFRKTSYKAYAKQKATKWDISLTITSAALINRGGCL